MDSHGFTAFRPELIDFLIGIEFNNSKDWFEENRGNYMEYVKRPFLDLASGLSDFMLAIDQLFETRGEKILSRIYRDVRFSKDKRPYRSSVWITFRRMDRDWKFDPCFFFEITPMVYRYGMGYYTASRETMANLRRLIENGDESFIKLKALYDSQKIFDLEGEKYKKILDKSKEPDILEWYQRKNIYFMCTKKIDRQLFSKELIEELKDGFTLLRPFYEFLWSITEA